MFFQSLIFIFSLDLTYGLPYECSVGFWGSRCHVKCGECDGGPRFCHVHDGRCVNGCGPGFNGSTCKKACPSGTHGQYCRYECGKCSDVAPICDVKTGECKGGCAKGFQKPFCKLPCPYGTWGDDCLTNCKCDKGVSQWCGCHHVSGVCQPCDFDGKPLTMVLKDPGHVCINPFNYDDIHGAYVHKSVLAIPWVPIVSFMGLIAAFVLSNFIYWYFWVRVATKNEAIWVERSAKPYMHQVSSWTELLLNDADTDVDGTPTPFIFRHKNLTGYLEAHEDRLQKQIYQFENLKLKRMKRKQGESLQKEKMRKERARKKKIQQEKLQQERIQQEKIYQEKLQLEKMLQERRSKADQDTKL